MARRNSSGSSSGRRGSSRTNSGSSGSGRGKSTGRPFKKSAPRSSSRSSSFGGDEKRPFKKRDDRSEKGSGAGRGFKKFDKPYGKSGGGSSESREGSSFRNKRDEQASDRAGSGRGFKKFDKKRAGSSDAGSRPYGNDRRGGSSAGRSDSGRGFKKFDKPFDKKEGGSSESRGRSYGNKSGGQAGARSGSGRDFKKFDKAPFEKRDEGSSDRPRRSGGIKKGEGFKKGPSFGLPYKRTYGKKTGDSSGTGRKSYGNKREGGRFDKPFDKETEGSSASEESLESTEKTPRAGKPAGDEPKGFFKKQKIRYTEKSETGSTAESAAPAQTEKIRLNRYIANSGVCSRREADELIAMGLISVNGKTISEMGYKVNPGDEVRYENKILKAEKPVYILMNKPKGFLTTTEDPQERNTVMHIIGNSVKERIYPVGRLDRNTTGLLLLTNDGDLADKLMHPSYNAKKIYKVELDRPLTKTDFQTIKEGVMLEEGRAVVDDLAIVSDDGKTVGVEIHIGWNRVVRRIFETLGYSVVRLDRSVYAGLDKKDLGRGQWRYLTKEELIRLKHYK